MHLTHSFLRRLIELAGLSRQVLNPTQRISIVAIFSSLIVATDWLISIPNVKLVDPLVFASSYTFGLKIGISIAILSQLIWGIVNPLGFGGPIIIFTIGGEIIYAILGKFAARIWKVNNNVISSQNLYFGSLVAIGAFLFDLETNFATALIIHWPPNVALIATTLAFGISFAITHELADFVLGAALTPIIIYYFQTRLVKKEIEVGISCSK